MAASPTRRIAILASSGGNLRSHGGDDPAKLILDAKRQIEAAGFELVLAQFVAAGASMDSADDRTPAQLHELVAALRARVPVVPMYFSCKTRPFRRTHVYFGAPVELSAFEGKFDSETLKAATEKLTDVSYDVFGKIYQQTAQQNPGAGFDPSQAAGGAEGTGEPQHGDDNVVDAEYEVVDDDKK